MKRAGVAILCLGILSLIATFVIVFIAGTTMDTAFIVNIVSFSVYTAHFSGIGICAGIFLMVIAFWRKMRGPRNTAGFLFAIGEVIEAYEAGAVVNGNPQVKIKFFYAAQDGRLITAEIQRVLPYGTADELKPGRMIMIWYDPQNTQKAVLETNATPEELNKAKLTFLAATGVFDSHKLNIVDKGRTARAVVTASRPTEETVGRRRIWELEVSVENTAGGSYGAYARQPVLPEQEIYMLPGTIVKVHYLPSNENDIVVAFLVEDGNGGAAR